MHHHGVAHVEKCNMDDEVACMVLQHIEENVMALGADGVLMGC